MLDPASYISVQGQGSLHVVPDVMRLEIGVSVFFKTYEEAYRQGQENTTWVKEILKDNGLAPGMAKTVDFDIAELREPLIDEPGFKHLSKENSGYKLHQKLRVDLPIDENLASNIVRMIGEKLPGVHIDVGFTLRDIQQLQLKLIERAVSDASVKAKVMAEAAGCLLGRVVKINYTIEKPDVYRHARTIHTNEEAKSNTPAALDIKPADFIVADTVEVTWNLK